MATVMPVAYQPAASHYNGPTTLYQSPVVYSTDQFANQQAMASQVAQYPMGFPMGYATYPVNGKLKLKSSTIVEM